MSQPTVKSLKKENEQLKIMIEALTSDLNDLKQVSKVTSQPLRSQKKSRRPHLSRC